jgi:hypothetical protein
MITAGGAPALQFGSAEYDGAALLRQLSGDKNSADGFEEDVPILPVQDALRVSRFLMGLLSATSNTAPATPRLPVEG